MPRRSSVCSWLPGFLSQSLLLEGDDGCAVAALAFFADAERSDSGMAAERFPDNAAQGSGSPTVNDSRLMNPRRVSVVHIFIKQRLRFVHAHRFKH